MRTVLATDPAGNRASLLEVRNSEGDLVGRVSMSKAAELTAAGLVTAFMRGDRIKYLYLCREEPTLERPWRGGSRTTERIRNRQGVVIGAPKSGLQHKPLIH